MPAVYLTALHVVFIGSLRYRQSAMLTLAILAAVGVRQLMYGKSLPTRAADLNES
jgi:hypothetical protein